MPDTSFNLGSPLAITPLRDPALFGAEHLHDNQRSFAAALGRAEAPGSSKPQTNEERATDVAEQYITQTLILPLLKQLRATNNAAPPFAPTQAERQFGALQDAELAQRIAHAKHFPLVDRVARDLLKRLSAEPVAAKPGEAPPDPLHLAELKSAPVPDSRAFPGTPRLVPGAQDVARHQ